MTHSIALGPGREFDIIRSMIARFGDRAVGIGDDAALLDVPAGERLVVSTDTSVEDVHFRREWLGPHEIGYRATASALSDLAAMGATPLGVAVALSLPRSWVDQVGALAGGIAHAAAVAETRIIGGDVSAARELAICVTVLGSARQPLGRDGARSGNAVYVTGTFGAPLASLRALALGKPPDPVTRVRFAMPIPRIREARWLSDRGATAAIDVSDGVLGDIRHLAAASGVRIVLDLDKLPTIKGMSPADAALSGEEFELIVTAPATLDAAAFTREFKLPLTTIGRVETGTAGVVATARGERVASEGGFSHF